MKKNIFIEFKDSIFSLNSYADLPKQSLKRSFLYLFLITFLIGSFSLLTVFKDFDALASLIVKSYDTIPIITAKDGVLTLDNDTQQYITESDNSILYIDTNENPNTAALMGYEHGILLTRNSLHIKIRYIEQSFTIPFIGDGELNKDFYGYVIPVIESSKYILIIIGVLSLYISNIFTAVLIAFFSNLLLNVARIPFSGVFKITVHALTLPLMLTGIESILNKPVPFSSVIFYGICILYINYGLNKIAFLKNRAE